jgi:serpin B
MGLTLLKKLAALRRADQNIFISPLSISMALGMTEVGAANETAQGMLDVMALSGLSQKEIQESYRSLLDLLKGLDSQLQITVANSIWYRTGLPVSADFIDTNRTYFDAEVTSLDFSSAGAAGTINQWVSDETKGLIPEIVDDPIDPDMVMFLINATYFKGGWTTPFDKRWTAPRPFTLADGSVKEAPGMATALGAKAPVWVGGSRRSGWWVGEVPYSRKAFSLLVLLPDRTQDIFTALEALDQAQLDALLASLEEVETGVSLPKLKLTYTELLNDALAAMGMSRAFSGQADFSNLCAGCGPGTLRISEVKHKTFVDVNEEGTEAAAATEVGSVLVSNTESPWLVVDRPFLVMIRERESGTILFLGLIVDPTLGQ